MKTRNVARAVVSAVFATGLALGALSAHAAILTDTNSTAGVFDASSGNRTFNLGAGVVQDVNIAITFSKCDDPSNSDGGACNGSGLSFNQEIVFRLTSPDGTVVNLVNAGTYSGQTPGSGEQTVTFDDEALAAVGGPSVVTGIFRPVSPLSAIDGENALGIWTLFIQDTVGADPLNFFTSTLTVVVDGVPEPASLALVGIALLAAAGAARRRKA